MDLLEAQAAGADRDRHNPRPGLRRGAIPEGRGGQPRHCGPRPRHPGARPEVLAATYGGHLLVLDGQAMVLDDAHHHDQAPPRAPLPRGRAPVIDAAQPLGDAFFLRALVASALVGLVCAVVGTYVVLGASRSSAMRPATRLPGRRRRLPAGVPYYLGAACRDRHGAGDRLRESPRRLRADTAIGVLFAGTFALGVFLFSIQGYVADLFSFLFGDVLAIDPRTWSRCWRWAAAALSSACCGRSCCTRPSTRWAPRHRDPAVGRLEYVFLAIGPHDRDSLQAVGSSWSWRCWSRRLQPPSCSRSASARGCAARGRHRRSVGRRPLCVLLARCGDGATIVVVQSCPVPGHPRRVAADGVQAPVRAAAAAAVA